MQKPIRPKSITWALRAMWASYAIGTVYEPLLAAHRLPVLSALNGLAVLLLTVILLGVSSGNKIARSFYAILVVLNAVSALFLLDIKYAYAPPAHQVLIAIASLLDVVALIIMLNGEGANWFNAMQDYKKKGDS